MIYRQIGNRLFGLQVIKIGEEIFMIIATVADMKKNFGRYLHCVMSEYTINVTKGGHEVWHFVPKYSYEGYLGTKVSMYLPS